MSSSPGLGSPSLRHALSESRCVDQDTGPRLRVHAAFKFRASLFQHASGRLGARVGGTLRGPCRVAADQEALACPLRVRHCRQRRVPGPARRTPPGPGAAWTHGHPVTGRRWRRIVTDSERAFLIQGRVDTKQSKHSMLCCIRCSSPGHTISHTMKTIHHHNLDARHRWF